jgi:hypothetical protein
MKSTLNEDGSSTVIMTATEALEVIEQLANQLREGNGDITITIRESPTIDDIFNKHNILNR